MDIVGNDREGALAKLDAKAAAARAAGDDRRLAQIEEQRARIQADLDFLREHVVVAAVKF